MIGPFASAIAGPVAAAITQAGAGGQSLESRVRALFANGEQGAWYDPSDLSTLFQDSAGTTPVTAVEQPAGKILDKSGRGNHASQPTSAARPVLSARSNRLLQSENMMGDAWAGLSGCTRTAAASNPTGFTNAATYTHDGVTAPADSFVRQVGSGYVDRVRFLVRSESGSGKVKFRAQGADIASIEVDLVAGTITDNRDYFYNPTITAYGGGWYWVTGTVEPNFANNDFRLYPFALGDVFSIAAAHMGDDTPYQRVNTATDYDTVGFPYYLAFDGVDDYLRTTFPNLGSNVTIGRSIPGTGASILTGQTIGAGNWDDSTSHCALVIIDRALTGPETALLTEYLNTRAGL